MTESMEQAVALGAYAGTVLLPVAKDHADEGTYRVISGLVTDTRARAWPAVSTPAATRRWTAGVSRSSRSVLLICGRERPMRSANSSCVHPKSSSSC